MSDVLIRHLEERDLPALLAIYNHYIVHTHITFDIEPRTLEDRRAWLSNFWRTGRHQCFVAVREGEAFGWAASTRLNERAAYETSVLVGVYLAPAETGKGIGRQLYSTLFTAIGDADIHRIHAGIAYPNPSSVALHLGMGFRLIGVQSQVGRKFGKFWDAGLYERTIDGSWE